jgi:hypothetical protein
MERAIFVILGFSRLAGLLLRNWQRVFGFVEWSLMNWRFCIDDRGPDDAAVRPHKRFTQPRVSQG